MLTFLYIMKRFLFLSLISFLFVFSLEAKLDGNGYYRIRSAWSSADNDILGLINDEFNYDAIVQAGGGGLAIIFGGDQAKAKALAKAKEYMTKDLSLSTNLPSINAGEVFYIQLHNQQSKEYDILTQNTGLNTIATGVYHSSMGDFTINDRFLIIDPVTGTSGGTTQYLASVQMNVSSFSLGTNYFTNESNHTLGFESPASGYNKKSSKYTWFIEPYDTDFDTKEVYFSLDPSALIEDGDGHYYTTLRTSFNYKIQQSAIKAFVITGVDNNNVITKTELTPTSGDNYVVVPAGAFVLLECNSNSTSDNVLLPTTEEASQATTTAVTNNKLVSSVKYFDKQQAGSNWKQLGNSNGLVGFMGSAISGKTANGNRGYLQTTANTVYLHAIPEAPALTNTSSEYDTEQLVNITCPTSGVIIYYTTDGSTPTVQSNIYNGTPITLSEDATIKAIASNHGRLSEIASLNVITPKSIESITDLNDNSTVYHITNPLIVAYVDKNNVVYAKDNNGASVQNPGGKTDFMKEHYKDDTHADHSNWVAIETASAPSVDTYNTIDAIGKVKEGSFPNRRIVGRVKKLEANNPFSYNTYCVVNFMDKTFHKGYFFASPAANEVANIIWAQYAGNNTFIAPPSSTFDGGFTADFSLYNGPVPTLTQGHVYGFLALIEKTATTASGISPKATMTSGYIVYPLEEMKDWSNTVTGVTTVQATSNVVSVKYYNAMGVESSVPFKGVNIVVTTYDNGTRTTSKMIR